MLGNYTTTWITILAIICTATSNTLMYLAHVYTVDEYSIMPFVAAGGMAIVLILWPLMWAERIDEELNKERSLASSAN